MFEYISSHYISIYIKHTDAHGSDFGDLSDSKTASIVKKISKKGYASYVVTIIGVEHKVGALRVSLWNKFKDSWDYFLIPYDIVLLKKRPVYGKDVVGERIQFNWNAKGDHYNYFEKYRVKTFRVMSLAKGC